jgi:Amt family ammonium transporter
VVWLVWFQCGSALGAIAVQALGTTTAAAAAGWFGILDKTWTQTFSDGSLYWYLVGLVAITPAAGFVSIPHAIFIGIFSSIVSNL